MPLLLSDILFPAKKRYSYLNRLFVHLDIETVFLVSKPEYSFLSSSIAKEVAQYGGDITSFIPEAIHEDVLDRLRKSE